MVISITFDHSFGIMRDSTRFTNDPRNKKIILDLVLLMAADCVCNFINPPRGYSNTLFIAQWISMKYSSYCFEILTEMIEQYLTRTTTV
jgi:hypothetical protein